MNCCEPPIGDLTEWLDEAEEMVLESLVLQAIRARLKRRKKSISEADPDYFSQLAEINARLKEVSQMICDLNGGKDDDVETGNTETEA
jgi:hypothetical protein